MFHGKIGIVFKSKNISDGDDGSAGLMAIFPSIEVTRFILSCGYDVHSRNYVR